MATLASYDAALKDIYRDSLTESLTYRDRPLLGFMPKYEDFGGDTMPIVIKYGNTQGVSASFSIAQANVTDSKLTRFSLTRVEKHSLAHIGSHVAAATMKKAHAFLKAIKDEVDSAMDALSDTLESDGFRDGSGAIGQISAGSNVATDTVTLADINDVTNFEPGMTLVANNTATGAVKAGTEVLESVNRSTGEITATSAAWNTAITTIAASDYLFRQGDAQNGGSPVNVSGLAAWLPDISGGIPSTSFFGVNRSIDSRLAGTYHDGSSQPIEEALIDAQSKAAREGGRPDHVFLNNAQYRKLCKQLGSKKEYAEVNATGARGVVAHISYRGVMVEGDKGPLKVVAANKCQSDIAWVLERKSWLWASLGKVVRFDDTDGNRILRRATASGVEARLVSWSQIGNNAPVRNARCTLSAA